MTRSMFRSLLVGLAVVGFSLEWNNQGPCVVTGWALRFRIHNDVAEAADGTGSANWETDLHLGNDQIQEDDLRRTIYEDDNSLSAEAAADLELEQEVDSPENSPLGSPSRTPGLLFCPIFRECDF